MRENVRVRNAKVPTKPVPFSNGNGKAKHATALKAVVSDVNGKGGAE